MSNPVATIGNTINEPSDPKVVRKTYNQIVFEAQKFFLYAEAEDDSTFNPADKGQSVFVWQRIGQIAGVQQPSFVSDASWSMVKMSPSGFVTANHSVMPKIMVPSKILVDNGPVSQDQQETLMGEYYDGSKWTSLFNWYGTQCNGSPISSWLDNWFKYLHVGSSYGSMYVTSRWKDDTASENSLEINLDDLSISPYPWPATYPTGEWDPAQLVIGGAFVLFLNVEPSTTGHTASDDTNKSRWEITIQFGEVTLIIGEAGSLKGTISTEGNSGSGNLAEGKTKEGPPQQWKVEGKEPYIIMVYPVWNGIIVASGQQDSKGTILTSSTYIPKLRAPNIFLQPYSSGFQVTNPAPVGVQCGTIATPDYVLVDFGKKMTATAKNCKFDLAYLPAFFGMQCWFDSWLVENDDISGTVSYDYTIYPIYTQNGTDYELDPLTVTDSGIQGPVADTSYWLAKWRFHRPAGSVEYTRFAGEIFGYVLETSEERPFPIRNANGSFDITWSGGTPAGVSTNWKDYVQSIQISIGLDGSSGSVTVDKYGVAGQDAVANQKIGAFTIAVTGGYGTQAGSIFQGLAMGIANQESSGNSTWTIPLVGQEKKMDDIALINVPFFDGYPLQDAVDFLCRYAGINYSMAYADGSIRLSQSSEINVPIFDWKTGTTVKSALDSVMNDTLHSYIIRDGVVYFYQLDDITSLPIASAGFPDWSTSYPNTKVVTIDKTPDFEDLKNQIVVMALQQVPQGRNTEITDIPTVPILETVSSTTTPDIPWAKSMFHPLSGTMTQSELAAIAQKFAAKSSTYDMGGSITIPGNANIHPYDRWGEFVISSVSHSADFTSKVWTTSLELTRNTRI